MKHIGSITDGRLIAFRSYFKTKISLFAIPSSKYLIKQTILFYKLTTNKYTETMGNGCNCITWKFSRKLLIKIIRNWNYRFRTVSLLMDMDTVKVLICIFVTMSYGRILSTVCLTLITSRNVNIGNIQNLRCHSMLPVITHRWC